MQKRVIQTNPFRVRKTYFHRGTGEVSSSLFALCGKKEIDRSLLPVFFKTGFVGGNKTLFRDIDCLPGGAEIEVDGNRWKILRQFRYEKMVIPEKYKGYSVQELEKFGANLLIRIIDEHYKPGSEIVIPISSGLDSRAILAAALRVVTSDNIRSYTFGIPGSYDFELGSRVARELGVSHKAFNLDLLPVTEDRLRQAAQLSNANTDLFQIVFLTYIFEEFGPDREYWIGYLGGPLSGKHPVQEQGIDETIRTFLSFNTYTEYNALDDMTVIRENLLENIVSENGNVLDQLDFYNRQERYISHQLFFDGFDYFNPLTHPDFIEFMLSLPPVLREHRVFYRNMLKNRFRSVFRFPGKATGGLPLTAPPLVVNMNNILNKAWRRMNVNLPYNNFNYIDYKTALTSRQDISKIISERINYLNSTGIISADLANNAVARYHASSSTGLFLTLLTALAIIHELFES